MFSQRLSLINLTIVFVRKIGEIRSSFGPDRPVHIDPVVFLGTVFAEFRLVTEDSVKTVV